MRPDDVETTEVISISLVEVFKSVAKIFNHRGSFGHYQLILSMFIESSALYSTFDTLWLVTYAVGNPICQLWLGLSPPVQVRDELYTK